MRIHLFGGLELVSSGLEPARLPTRKTALVVAALALSRKRMTRQALCDLFWPDREEEQGRSSLRQALTAIRKLFPDDGAGPHVSGNIEAVQLAARPDDVDAWRFDALVETNEPSRLVNAADLYRGDILSGINLSDPLDQWFAPYQRSYRRKALDLVERLSQMQGAQAGPAEGSCEALAERLLSADPAAEEAHRALVRLYQRQGRMNAALRQFDLCKEALKRELGVEPEPQTSALIARPAETARPTGTDGPPAGVGRAGAVAPRLDRGQPSIIVMPFENLSGEADGYFVDGVVEEITSALSRVREFFVIARQSAFTYKGRFVDVRDVGRELGVNYVVEGTVRRGGDRLRISVQLIDAETRTQLWSERYEGANTDIFAFQDLIAAQVAGAINPAIRNAEIDSVRRKPPGSLRAYDLVLQAYPRIWSQDQWDNRDAIAILDRVIETDPQYGRAHALLAWCHSREVVYLWATDHEVSLRRACESIDAAAGLIGDDPTALAAVGAVISQCLDDLPRAAAFVERALALDPNGAWAWSRYAWVAIYQYEPDRAIERFERSLALSPLDPHEFNLRSGIASALGQKGEYARAAKLIQEVLSRYPKATWAYRQLAHLAALAGDLPTARDAVRKLLAAYPNVSVELMKRQHPSRNRPVVFNQMLEGWRLAGLPER